MAADHVNFDLPVLQRVVSQRARIAAEGAVVTFGITPDAPETDYGYIQSGLSYPASSNPESPTSAKLITRFVEKPDLTTAQAYLDAGSYSWHSGLFMMRASVWLSAMAACRPDILLACQTAWDQGATAGEFVRVGREAFAQCPADSIDFAVMERIATGAA